VGQTLGIFRRSLRQRQRRYFSVFRQPSWLLDRRGIHPHGWLGQAQERHRRGWKILELQLIVGVEQRPSLSEWKRRRARSWRSVAKPPHGFAPTVRASASPAAAAGTTCFASLHAQRGRFERADALGGKAVRLFLGEVAELPSEDRVPTEAGWSIVGRCMRLRLPDNFAPPAVRRVSIPSVSVAPKDGPSGLARCLSRGMVS
jgi:hypothetical protein